MGLAENDRPVHLTVISYPMRPSSTFEDVAFAVDPATDEASKTLFAFARCHEPSALPGVVAQFGTKKVKRLDLYGHGDSGKLRLGESLLVGPGNTAWDVIRQLKDQLADNATVRLVGCFTGTCDQGRDALRKLSEELELEVWGTNAIIYRRDFSRTGLRPDVAESYLVSTKHLIRSVVQPVSRVSASSGPKGVESMFTEPLLSRGYTCEGRDDAPAAIIDVRGKTNSVEISIACGGRLVLVQGPQERQPLLFLFKSCKPPAGGLSELRSTLRI